jgi:hypothetical protein
VGFLLVALLDLSSTQYLQSYYALLGLSWATDFITEQSNLNPELAPMHYLSSISLALVVLMALACTATPTTTPTPPGPMLAEADAIAVVKNYLGLKTVGRLRCFAYYDARDPSWTARYDGDGVWKVRADIAASVDKHRSTHPGKWDMYEKTKSVVTTTGYKC